MDSMSLLNKPVYTPEGHGVCTTVIQHNGLASYRVYFGGDCPVTSIKEFPFDQVWSLDDSVCPNCKGTDWVCSTCDGWGIVDQKQRLELQNQLEELVIT